MRLEYWIPLAAYLLGSIPFGYVLVRLQAGADIRSVGSGNIGATNVYRKSRAAGIATLLLDAAKGYAAVAAAQWVTSEAAWHAAAAFTAVLGHVFTVWLAFKGGKGVATAAGAYLALAAQPLTVALAVFLVLAAATRYVSLGSIAAAAVFPLAAYLLHNPAPVVVAALAASALIIAKHHANIRRLIAGTENRFALSRRA